MRHDDQKDSPRCSYTPREVCRSTGARR
jgi:hypothetical protein